MSNPACPCGHDRHHRAVQPILRRGPLRWLVGVLLDAELAPREVRFVCAVCDTEVECACDAQTLRQYGRWPLVDRESLRGESRVALDSSSR